MRQALSVLMPVALICGMGLAMSAGEARAVVLITPREAALPDAVGAHPLGARGVSRGPKVQVLSPAPDAGVIRSPLDLVVRFVTHGGAAIELLSVKVTYLKNPAINLTQRIGNLVTASGIEVHGAEVPPGTHYIRVEIKDDAGRTGALVFPLVVAN
jgi:hypothetical protein